MKPRPRAAVVDVDPELWHLAARGAISRDTDGTWVLHGAPPSELAA